MLKEPDLSKNAPWKQRFRVEIISWAQIAHASPDRGLVCTSKSGNYQLYAWDTNTGYLRQLTDRLEGVFMGFISPDGRYVYYMQDTGGNEIGHWVRIPYEGGKVQDITPDMPPYSSFALNISPAGNYIGSTIVNTGGFHVMVWPVQNNIIGNPRELHQNQKMAFGPVLSADGKIGVIASTEHATLQHHALMAFELESGKRISEFWDGSSVNIVSMSFSPIDGDYRLATSTNFSGFNRPLIWNPVNGERTEVVLGGLPGEVSPADWSADGKQILLSQHYKAMQRLFVYDLATKTMTKLEHPQGSFGMRTFFVSKDEIYATWEDSIHPPQLIALDNRTGLKKRTVLSAGDVPTGHPWKSVTFTSTDGQAIQGWLGLPEGKGPFPTILHTHGGPEVVTTDTFIPASQTWLDHGFAFLAINYRGSIGFGREFREKIWGNLGHWEIEDMVAAHNWLVKEGIAQPKQILLTGWSYGGYLTLLALGKHPDLWAGGMAGIATTDWAAEYDYLSDALKGYSVAIFGGTPQEKPEQYARSSPMTYAENIRAPVLIIQGRNDTRTPARPVEMYESRLKSLGKDIEVYWFDAGHFGGGVEEDILHQELMLKFAYRVTGYTK